MNEQYEIFLIPAVLPAQHILDEVLQHYPDIEVNRVYTSENFVTLHGVEINPVYFSLKSENAVALKNAFIGIKHLANSALKKVGVPLT